MQRRHLLQGFAGAGALTLLAGTRGWAAAPSATDNARPRLIVVMLRGAVDGLSVVVPYAEPNYYQMRSSIALPRPGDDGGLIDLDGHFGLHPALAPLLPMWQSHELAFVHAAGSPDPSRSHFDAQDYMESGTPGNKRTPDGWMNRLLLALDAQPQSLDAVSLGPVLPRIFSGVAAVANVPLGRQAGRSTAMDRPDIGAAFDRMYAGTSALDAAYQQGRGTHRQILADLGGGDSSEMRAADNGAPPAQGFPLDASQLAQLIRMTPQMQLAFMQLGGWDTHVNQGATSGQLAGHLKPLAEGLASLRQQLGDEFSRTVIVVMSEFGRTARQNGSGGTDHGHGNVMWLLGGPLNGGRVYGEWPGIDDASLHEQRDLAVTTDFRTVLAEICSRHLQLDARGLARVFPQAPTHANAALQSMLRA